MDTQRQGEIALLLVRKQLTKRGLLGEGFRRELGNAAKDLGVEPHELEAFYEKQLPFIIGEMLGRKDVLITTRK